MYFNANIMHRMCLRKKKYRSQEFAESMAKKLGKKFNTEFMVYRCKLCGYWHLATKKGEDNEQKDNS